MNFLDRLRVIPRTNYPHFACNIVIELRKYHQDFYLEFYYNDILKYNNTLNNFKGILDNSEYSNLYNYCGKPIKRSSLNKTLNNETEKKEINNKENTKNKSNYLVNQNNYNKAKYGKNILNNSNIIVASFPYNANATDKNRIKTKNKTIVINYGKKLLKKSFLYLAQKDIKIYILGTMAFIAVLIIFYKLIYIWKKNKRKSVFKFKKNRANNIDINARVLISNESEIKIENNIKISKSFNTFEKSN